MKRFVTILIAIMLAMPAVACPETFYDLQQEINRTAPINYDTQKLHVFSGTIMSIEYKNYCFDMIVAVDDDGSNPFIPYWSEYAYFFARFAAFPDAELKFTVGDHVEITGQLEPKFSSVRVPCLDVVAVNGEEEFW